MRGYLLDNIKRICQLTLLAVGIFFNPNIFGQDVCTQNLMDARESFADGRFLEVDSLLRNCIKNGFTKVERIEALKILSLTKLYMDEMSEADSLYLKLLLTDPEHQVNELLDPPDLIFLHNSFRTEPIFSWAVGAGINYSFPTIINEDYPFPSTTIKYNDGPAIPMQPKKKYTPLVGYSFTAEMDFVLLKDLYVGIGLSFSKNRYRYSTEYLKSLYTTENTDILYYEAIYIQNLNWFHIPLKLTYQFGKLKFKPYISAGASYDYLLISKRKDLIREKISGEPETKIEQGSSKDTFSKNRNNFSMLFSVGMMYKTNGIDYIVLELSYAQMFNNIANSNERYGDIDTQTDIIFYAIALDSFSLSSFNITLKFLRPFYRPRKIDK